MFFFTDNFRDIFFVSMYRKPLREIRWCRVISWRTIGDNFGALLFILYANDIINVVQQCKVKLFADNAITYLSGESYEDMINNVNDDLNNIYKDLCTSSL